MKKPAQKPSRLSSLRDNPNKNPIITEIQAAIAGERPGGLTEAILRNDLWKARDTREGTSWEQIEEAITYIRCYVTGDEVIMLLSPWKRKTPK
jgi:hypothetical protein